MPAAAISEYQTMIQSLVKVLEDLTALYSIGPFPIVREAKELVENG